MRCLSLDALREAVEAVENSLDLIPEDVCPHIELLTRTSKSIFEAFQTERPIWVCGLTGRRDDEMSPECRGCGQSRIKCGSQSCSPGYYLMPIRVKPPVNEAILVP